MKFKHLTLDQRIDIQECLFKGMSFKQIAKRIGKDQTTVSKEVKKHLVVKPDAKGAPCERLLRAPFVCNPCRKCHSNCGFAKQFYYAKSADKAYEELLSVAREGIALNKEEFYDMDRIVSNGLNKGQHLYHIHRSNNLNYSVSAIYNYRKKGYLSVNALDFPRVAKFKSRKVKFEQYVPKKLKIGRTYDDFKAFCAESGTTHWVEMDTVIGRIGGKAILTLHFTNSNFMVGLLLDSKSTAEVTNKLDRVDYKILNVILTDNGGEFSDIHGIERQKARLFFCDPYQSSQKPNVEKNHTLLRDIVPSGTSFDSFTQETVDLMFSHINNVKRASLNGKTPYELFTFFYGEETTAALGIKQIPAQEVIQSPKLLKK